MQKPYSQLGRHSLWRPDNACTVRQQPAFIKPLMNDKGSLTAALVRLAQGAFRVRVLQQHIAVPLFHEQRTLARPLHKAAMIREVELLVHETPVVYARSIVPLSLVSNGKNGLANLGRTPLGHLLFKDGRIRVSKREFAFITYDQQSLTARRTPYEYQGSTILVSEFFLPALKGFL